jgi:outer membrane protein OmpA-like peptidoglycan-associated protein
MKKILRFSKWVAIISLVMLVFLPNVKAQSFSPFNGDNYAGITGIYNNPASIANSRYIVDINLLGGSNAFTNNYFGFNRKFMLNQFNFNETKREMWRDLWFKKPWLLPNSEDGTNSYVRLPEQSSEMYSGAFENEIQLLSFMVAINPKMSIGFSDRVRSITNFDNASWGLMETFFTPNPLSSLGTIANGEFRMSSAVWNEMGLTFATQIYDGGNHYFKGGLTVKLLQGLTSSYLVSDDITLQFDDNDNVTVDGDIMWGISEGLDEQYELIRENKEHNIYTNGNSQFKYNHWGNLTSDYFNAYTDEFLSQPFNSKYWDNLGLGLDLGFVYEWRPDYEDYKYDMDGKTGLTRNDLNKYKLRVSVAVMDIGLTGGIKYVRDANLIYNMASVNGTFATSIFSDLDDGTEEINAAAENSFGSDANSGTMTAATDSVYKMQLPTTLTFAIDFNLGKNFYLNLGTSVPFTAFNGAAVTELASGSYDKIKLHTTTAINLTPRYERKWFGVSIPLTYQFMNTDKLNVGLGLRLGPVWIGSNTVVSNLARKYWDGVDICAAVKIPIMYCDPKDKDSDGVSDKKDECPTLPGTWETRGCPDTDGDGIVDAEDECPYQAGLAEFNGCPDTDGDGIPDKEDACPEVPGLAKFNGCPDTDGDGIPDNEDLCPEEKGVPEYKGCPKSKFVQDTDGDGIPDELDDCPLVPGIAKYNGCPEAQLVQANDVAVVYFETNKYNIKTNAYPELDKIVNIANNGDNKEVTIKVVGHCDATGNDRINDPLSVKRAERVKQYFIEKGVDQSTISSEGKGSHDPVDTNKTAAGRAKNRRVEVEISFMKSK